MPSNIVVPEVGESIVDARVARWLRKAGDVVAIGDPLVELETDKIDLEVAAPQAGVLARIDREDGTDVKVGEVLGVIEDATADLFAEQAAAVAGAGARPAAGLPAVADGSSSRPAEKAGQRTEERVRMSKRRATIARRLVEAQSTSAMLTTFNEVDMSAVMALRERHKQAFKDRHGVGLGITSFFVKASVGALGEFPRINAEIQGDEIVLKRYYDIGVAVGASEGLVVPVLRDADRMSFAEIEQRIRDFARRAEDGTLTLEDLRGGTFTITNGGVFGSLLSTPILNPPQAGILGLHAIQQRPVAVNGQVVIRPMMYVALTYDHRIVDGSEAVQFLVRVKQLVEDPGTPLLD